MIVGTVIVNVYNDSQSDNNGEGIGQLIDWLEEEANQISLTLKKPMNNLDLQKVKAMAEYIDLVLERALEIRDNLGVGTDGEEDEFDCE